VRGGSGVRQQHMDLTPRRDPSRRRDPRVCFGIDRPPKMPSDDVEPKRCEIRDVKANLLLLLGHEN
jgi:hypothetical protein